MVEPLESLARRAENEPFFLAWLLAAYARAENLGDDPAALAADLGCPMGELVMLRLCRAPRKPAREFQEDIQAICDRFGIAPGKLMAVVKRGRVIRQMMQSTAADGPVQVAARDREPPPDEEGQSK
jgi:hypothetical protein